MMPSLPIWKRPAVFHGFLTGAVLFMVKFTLYTLEHWEIRFAPTYQFGSFALLMLGVVWAGTTERKMWGSEFGYAKALLSGLLVLTVATFLSVCSELLLYNLVDTSLNSQTKSILLESTAKGFEAFGNALDEATKDEIMGAIEKSNPGSPSELLAGWPMQILLNGLFLFVFALWTRSKTDATHSDWLSGDDAS
ncbi:MAG: hypothetical protein RL577_651 [Bacteroidota bacterium]